MPWVCKFGWKRLKKKLIKEEYTAKTAEIRHIDPKVTAGNIWGSIISALRRRDLTALYTACGDVRNINLDGDDLIVFIEDEYLYNIIAGEKNLQLLQEIVQDIDSAVCLKIEFAKKEDYVEKDIIMLKRKVGNILQIK